MYERTNTTTNIPIYWYLKYGGNGAYCIIKMARENKLYQIYISLNFKVEFSEGEINPFPL